MELEQLLSNLVSGVDGALAAAIGGVDGLLIDQFTLNADLDLPATVAETANLLRAAAAGYSGTVGPVRELIVSAERATAYTRQVSPGLFLLVLLSPGGNLGMARVLSTQAARGIQETLL